MSATVLFPTMAEQKTARFWRDLWAARADVVISPLNIAGRVDADVLAVLDACPSGWCAWIAGAHGCVRLRGSLMVARPELLADLVEFSPAAVAAALAAAGVKRCDHRPARPSEATT